MTAPLSTSSSNTTFNQQEWLLALLGSTFFVLAIVLFFEHNLRTMGWRPTLVDSPELWTQERTKASKLGSEALILVGASRIQLGLDLHKLEEISSKTPIQLAIDGANVFAVLKSLADDPRVMGPIILDINESSLETLLVKDKSWDWVEAYQHKKQQPLYRWVDDKISQFLTGNMATKLEGAKPHTVIYELAFKPKHQAKGNYLITNSNRSRDADYSKVDLPSFYLNRVIRNSGLMIPEEQMRQFAFVIDAYEAAIPTLAQGNLQNFEKNLNILVSLIEKIESRGGRVTIFRMPSSKLIWAMDQQRYPRDIFWKKILLKHPASFHFNDHPTLNGFDLPDGSHLDKKDKEKFTENLFLILKPSLKVL